jgi:TetR/AcrR family transcriptional regulator, transcriptional repressor for nem operon
MPATKTSKEEILRKSTHLIWEQGYKHTSFSDLSKACGIQNAHFYYYFKDKEDLMTQVLEGASELFKQKIFSVAYRDELPPEERLTLIIKKLNIFYMKNYGGCMFGNVVLETAHTGSPFLEIVKDLFKSFIAALQHIYSVKLSPEEAEAKAVLTVQQLEGAIMMMRLFKDRSYVDKAWAKITL